MNFSLPDEARNKNFKQFREYHTCKFSRTDTYTITDFMNMILILSNQVVSRYLYFEWNTKKLVKV